MTLHDAIQAVLTDAGRPRSTREIADAVNARGLYVRKDGRPVSATQVGARCNKFPRLFEKVEGDLWLARRKSIAGMTTEELGEVLLNEDRFQIAANIDSLVPNAPGLYAIRVADLQVLPEPFGEEARRRDDQLIYIGEAKTNLRTRFLNQELRARGHGTFVRSLGAVLGRMDQREPGGVVDPAGRTNPRNRS